MNTLKWGLMSWAFFISMGFVVFWISSKLFPHQLWMTVIAEIGFVICMGALLPATFEDVGLALGGHFKMPRLSLFCLTIAHYLFQVPFWRMTTSSLGALGAAKMQLLFGDLDEAEKWSNAANAVVSNDNWRCLFKAKLISGMIAFRRGQFDVAIARLEEALILHDEEVKTLTFASMVAELSEHKVTALDFLALARLAKGNLQNATDAFETAATIRDTISPGYAESYRHYYNALLRLAQEDKQGALEEACLAADSVPDGPMKPFDEYVILNLLQVLRSLGCDDAMHEFHLLEIRVMKHLHGFSRATWLNEFELLAHFRETPSKSSPTINTAEHKVELRLKTVEH